MGRVARRVALLAVTVVVVVPASAGALVEQPFASRFTTIDPGAVMVTGNTLMTCPAADADCASSQAGTAGGAALNNNAYAMERVDVDAELTTFNSSSSTFAPPASFEVLFAGLYFGGRVTAGSGGAPAPDAAARASALLRTPTSGVYLPVTGTHVDSTAVAGSYVAFADVTALVAAGGAGQYTVANVQSGTGVDRYAGWALVVVYRDPALPLRSLTVFDGLATIQQGDPPLSIGVSGFTTPLAGVVQASVGLVAYEGDRGAAGDRLALDGVSLSDAANPVNNLFNSSISFEGTDSVAVRTPGHVNQLGFDADRIVADGVLGNGATSATLEASTTLDQYLIQVATFTTDLTAPRLRLEKAVADLDGGDVEPGDVLRYTLSARNLGDDDATAVRIEDAAPAGTALVPGSLSGPGGTVAADGRAVTFDVGALAPGAVATATFDVVVDAGAPDGFAVRNVARVHGVGATAGQPVEARSPEVTAIVRRPAVGAPAPPGAPPAGGAHARSRARAPAARRPRLTVHKRAAVRVVRPGQVVAFRLVVRARAGGGAARNVRVCDVPGPGLRLLSASRGGVLRNGRACWRLGTLAPGRGASVTAVARTGTRVAVVRNVARVRAANLGRARPLVSTARVRVEPVRSGACVATAPPRGRAAC